MRVRLIGRALFVLFVGGLAGLAAWAAVVAYLARVAPDLALKFNRTDVISLLDRNDRDLIASGGTFDPARLAATARSALGSEPINAMALRQLGFSADAASAHDRARQLMLLANRASRRDFGVSAWMIEDRVSANDIRGALVFYDFALSTSGNAPKLLYPTLRGALSHEEVRAAFAPYLDKGRPWMPGFINYAISASADPGTIESLIVKRGGLPSDPVYRAMETQLLGRLVAVGQYDVARRYALTLPGGYDALADAGFTDRTMNPALAPFTWQLAGASEIQTQRDSDQGIQVVLEPSGQGEAASRTLMLAAGTYLLSQRIVPLPSMEAPRLVWELRCLPTGSVDAEPFWRVPLSSGAPSALVLVIPERCRVQRLSLVAFGADSQIPSGARVERVLLRRKLG